MRMPFLKKKPFSCVIWIGIVFFIIALGISGYFIITEKLNAHKKATEKLRLGVSKSFLSIPVYVAWERGYFEKEGLDVKITEYSSGKLAMLSMLKGENDIATVADMPVVINSFVRSDFCIIATFTYSYPFVKILTRRDTGINNGADLKGKKVGVNPGTSSHFYLSSFLIYNRLPISDVIPVKMRTMDMPYALKNKEVDAVSVWEPYAQEAEKLLKDNAVVLEAPDIYRTTFSFAVMKGYVGEHPETVWKFLKTVHESVEFIQNNRKESEEIIAAVFDIDIKDVDVWDDYIFGLFLDESLLIGWDHIARWAIENELTDKKTIPNYLNYICLDALEEVRPESVTIIR